MVDWDKIRNEFSITKNVAYLNNAAYAPMPLQSIEAVKDFLVVCSERGPDAPGFYEEIKDMAMKVRIELGKFLNCKSKELVYTESATQGINLVASMMNFQKGDEVVIRDGLHEHPSNYLPWLHVANHMGVRLRKLRIDKNGSFDLGELEKLVNERTKLLVLTHVLYNTGALIPVEEAGKIARERGTLFFVDASQSVGCMPVDVLRVRCDFLAFTGAKWLCGPLGIGGLYCRAEVAEEIVPTIIGSDAMETYSSGQYKYAKMPQRFQEGFRNFAGVVGLSSSLSLNQSIGIENIRRRDLALANAMREELLRLNNFEIYGPDDPSERNSILPFNIKGMRADLVVKRLAKRKIILAKRNMVRRGIVRASPHFFNSYEEVQRTVKALRSLDSHQI